MQIEFRLKGRNRKDEAKSSRGGQHYAQIAKKKKEEAERMNEWVDEIMT